MAYLSKMWHTTKIDDAWNVSLYDREWNFVKILVNKADRFTEFEKEWRYKSINICTWFQSPWYVRDMIQDIDNHNDALEKKIDRESDIQLSKWMDETMKELHSQSEMEKNMEN